MLDPPPYATETEKLIVLVRFIGTMDVDLSLEPEKLPGTSVVRAFFLRDNKETHVYNETLTMNQQTDPQLKCTDVTAYLIVSRTTYCTSDRFIVACSCCTLSSAVVSNGYTSKYLVPYWYDAAFSIF